MANDYCCEEKDMNEEVRNLITRRRRQILLHSYIYYEINDNLIDDVTWSKWALDLEQLQSIFPEESASTLYSEEFKGFDHSTGAGLDYFKSEIIDVSNLLIKYRGGAIPDAAEDVYKYFWKYFIEEET